MAKLIEENLRACTAAMRSGEFPQSTSRLRNNNDPQCDQPSGWCCLGVICEVFRRKTGRGTWVLSADSKFYFFELDGEEYQTHLPMPVWEWLGGSGAPTEKVSTSRSGSEVNPSLGFAPGRLEPSRWASDWNDVAGASLAAIADAFEAKYLGES
jgi:hypothetical protein